MTLLTIGQDMGRTLAAVDVLAAVQQRLQAACDENAAEALHHFHRLSQDELVLIVALEVGVASSTPRPDYGPATLVGGYAPSSPQAGSVTVAA